MVLNHIQKKVLSALVSAGGQMNHADIKILYEAKGDGQRVNHLVRHGFIEWVRGPTKIGIAVRITESGRALAETARGK